jgi:hypothetical protein
MKRGRAENPGPRSSRGVVSQAPIPPTPMQRPARRIAQTQRVNGLSQEPISVEASLPSE